MVSRNAAVAAVVALTLAAASACVQLPEKKTGAAPPWTPTSVESSVKFFGHYDTVHLEASEQRDAGLVATVESGPLLRVSEATYKIKRRVDPQRKDTTAPFTRTNPSIALPRFVKYPVWLLGTSAMSNGNGRQVVDLVTRSTAGAEWRNTISVMLDPNQTVPELQKNGDSAVPIWQPAQVQQLRRPPDKAAEAYAALIQGGPKAPQASAFVPHGLTATAHQLAALYRATPTKLRYEQTVKVIGYRALAAKDGGAFLVFAMEEKNNVLMLPGQILTLPATDEAAAFTGLTKVTKQLKTSYIWQVAAFVPAKGKGNGLVELLGVQRNLASAALV
jgi:hypothetical protein